MQLIDTHCHLDLADFNADRAQILSRCEQLGITKIIVPAIDSHGWQQLLATTTHHEQLYPALGLHPVFIDRHTEKDIENLSTLVAEKRPIAIGEIGLDFYIKDTDKNRQIDYFEQQLLVAEEADLPVILHVRKAHDTVIKMLRSKSLIGGSCHAFSGSEQQAKQYINMGFKLGFGGTMTYPNARKIHTLARSIPLEHILLETDAPDMSGYTHKGERNSPEYLTDALNALAELKAETPETVAKQTTENAERLFKI